VSGLASLFLTLGPSTRSGRQFTFTCLDVDLSARQRLWSTADPLDKASLTLEKVLEGIRGEC